MSDEELLKFGKSAKSLCDPSKNYGRPPREVFVIQLREVPGKSGGGGIRASRNDHDRALIACGPQRLIHSPEFCNGIPPIYVFNAGTTHRTVTHVGGQDE